MNIKLRAVARTAKVFAISTIAPLVVVSLFQIEPETLFYLFLAAFFAWMVWVVYSINLSQLESEETIRAIQERRETMLSNIVKNPE